MTGWGSAVGRAVPRVYLVVMAVCFAVPMLVVIPALNQRWQPILATAWRPSAWRNWAAHRRPLSPIPAW